MGVLLSSICLFYLTVRWSAIMRILLLMTGRKYVHWHTVNDYTHIISRFLCLWGVFERFFKIVYCREVWKKNELVSAHVMFCINYEYFYVVLRFCSILYLHSFRKTYTPVNKRYNHEKYFNSRVALEICWCDPDYSSVLQQRGSPTKYVSMHVATMYSFG